MRDVRRNPQKSHKEPDEKHLDKMTVKELREIASEIPHEKAVHEMKKRNSSPL